MKKIIELFNASVLFARPKKLKMLIFSVFILYS